MMAPLIKFAGETHPSGHGQSEGVLTLSESAWSSIECRPDSGPDKGGPDAQKGARGTDESWEGGREPDSQDGVCVVGDLEIIPEHVRESEMDMLRLCEGALSDLEEQILVKRQWHCEAMMLVSECGGVAKVAGMADGLRVCEPVLDGPSA
jgi:hypothetical protein